MGSGDRLGGDRRITREVFTVKARQIRCSYKAGNKAFWSAIDNGEGPDDHGSVSVCARELVAGATMVRGEPLDKVGTGDVRESGERPKGIVPREGPLSWALSGAHHALGVVEAGVEVEDSEL